MVALQAYHIRGMPFFFLFAPFSEGEPLERQAVAIAAISVISKHKLPAENFPYGCLCDVANGHHCGDTGISANFTVTLQGKQ